MGSSRARALLAWALLAASGIVFTRLELVVAQAAWWAMLALFAAAFATRSLRTPNDRRNARSHSSSHSTRPHVAEILEASSPEHLVALVRCWSANNDSRAPGLAAAARDRLEHLAAIAEVRAALEHRRKPADRTVRLRIVALNRLVIPARRTA